MAGSDEGTKGWVQYEAWLDGPQNYIKFSMACPYGIGSDDNSASVLADEQKYTWTISKFGPSDYPLIGIYPRHHHNYFRQR